MKKILFFPVLILLFACATANNESHSKQTEVTPKTVDEMPQPTIYNFKAIDIEGKEFDFSSLKGKKVMIVNTASECGFTPQYEQLEAIYKKYGGEKFEIIGFPANNFGGQEPGADSTIAAFCKKNYGVTFKMMSKISVVGDDQHEIYQWLTQKSKNGVEDAKVQWNFHKFLIDENGHYVKSVGTKTKPDDEDVVKWIEN